MDTLTFDPSFIGTNSLHRCQLKDKINSFFKIETLLDDSLMVLIGKILKTYAILTLVGFSIIWDVLPVPHWPILLSPQAYTVPRSISKQINCIDCFNKYNALLPLKWYAFLQYCQFAGYNAQTSIVSFILSATLFYLILFHSGGTIV